ncbi:MAG: isocitrate lyase/phosphoenolpyruvate mutase family protein [Pseudomonadota bacterium]
MHTAPPAAPGAAFLELHRAERGFLMPNAWDAGSAVVLAGEGFPAIGTTSAGIAFSLAKPDYEVRHAQLAVSRGEMLDAVRRIAQAVAVPVNADLESGYGDTPDEVGHTVRLAIEAGAAGCNLEDVDRRTGALFHEREAAQRIAAARAAIGASGLAFVLNARTDSALRHGEEGLRTAIERGNRYLEAGADCVFVPGITEVSQARLLAREIQGPVNLVVGLNESGSSAHALLEAGIRRVSVGGSIARAALGLVRRSARELLERGSVSYAAGQIAQAELNALFERAALTRRPAAS